MECNTIGNPGEDTESQLVMYGDSSSEDEQTTEFDPSRLPPSLIVQGNINVIMQVNATANITTGSNSVQIHQPEVDYNIIFEDLQQFWKLRANSRRSRLHPRKYNDVESDPASSYIRLEMKDRFWGKDYPVELEQLFESNSFEENTKNVGEKIFIQGNPGFGKTTLSHKIYEDWGENLHYVNKFQLAIFIQLRHLSKESFCEYFKHALIPYEKRDQGDKYWEALAQKQEVTLFILDGYDEVPKSLKTEIDSLMTRSLLSRSTVILTSRFLPSNAEMIACSTKNITIRGFASEQIIAFASKVLPQPLAEKFRATISASDVCHELAQCPLACNMLCQLFKSQQGNIPSNYTQLYTNMVKLQMRRAKFRNQGEDATSDEESSDDNSDEQIARNALFGSHDALLQRLGKLSWDSLLKNRFIFKRKRLRNALGEEYRNLVDLTLLYKEHELDSQAERSSAVYVFAHRTFQEFFAAFFLAKHVTSSQELASYLRKLMESHIDSLTMMLRFMAGLLEEKACLLFEVYCISRIDRGLAYELFQEITQDSHVMGELAKQLHYSLDCDEEDKSWLHKLVTCATSSVKEVTFSGAATHVNEDWSLQAFLGGDFPSHFPIATIAVDSDSCNTLGQLRFQPEQGKVDLLKLQLGFRSMGKPLLIDFYYKQFSRIVQLLNHHARLRKLGEIILFDDVPTDKQTFHSALSALCNSHKTLESLEFRFEGAWEFNSYMWDFVVNALSRSASLREISITNDVSFTGLETIVDDGFPPREALICALVDLSRTTNLRKLRWRDEKQHRPVELMMEMVCRKNWGNLTHLSLSTVQDRFNSLCFFKSLVYTRLESLTLKWWNFQLRETHVPEVLDCLKNCPLRKLKLVCCKFEITYPSIEMGDFQFPPEGSVLPQLTHLLLQDTIFQAWSADCEVERRVVNDPIDASLRVLSYFRSQLETLTLDGSAIMPHYQLPLFWFDFMQRLASYSQLTSLHIDVGRALREDAFGKTLFLRDFVVSRFAMPAVTSEYVSQALSLTNVVDLKLLTDFVINTAEDKSRLISLMEEVFRGLPYLQRLGIPSVQSIGLAKSMANLLQKFWKGKELRLDMCRGMFGVSYDFIHCLVHDLQYENEDGTQNFLVRYLGVSEQRGSSYLVQRKE